MKSSEQSNSETERLLRRAVATHIERLPNPPAVLLPAILTQIDAHYTAINARSIRHVRFQWAFAGLSIIIVSLALYFIIPSQKEYHTGFSRPDNIQMPSGPTQSSIGPSDASNHSVLSHHRASLLHVQVRPSLFPYHYVRHESEVRLKLLDMWLGKADNVDSFYRAALTHGNPEDTEVVRRWDSKIRITNIDLYERKKVAGIGWLVSLKGAKTRASGMNIELSTDSLEAEVRLKLAEIQLSGDSDRFKALTHDVGMTSREAQWRWSHGVRVTNTPTSIDRVKVGGNWIIESTAHDGPVPGMSIQLSDD